MPDFAWGREILCGIALGLAAVVVFLVHQRFDPSFEFVDDDAISSWQPIFTDFARQLGEGHLPVWPPLLAPLPLRPGPAGRGCGGWRW